MKTDVTLERLRELLDYDPETGIFTRRITRGNGAAGQPAGADCGRGYLKIAIDGRDYRAHRLAWFYHYGEWPPGEVDHKNTIKADNRIANLRLATPVENCRNRPLRSDNTSGYRGVSYSKAKSKWTAYIYIDGKKRQLGVHEAPEAAAAAYNAAATKHFGDFARLNEVA